jgi:hypothetical protein
MVDHIILSFLTSFQFFCVLSVHCIGWVSYSMLVGISQHVTHGIIHEAFSGVCTSTRLVRLSGATGSNALGVHRNVRKVQSAA